MQTILIFYCLSHFSCGWKQKKLHLNQYKFFCGFYYYWKKQTLFSHHNSQLIRKKLKNKNKNKYTLHLYIMKQYKVSKTTYSHTITFPPPNIQISKITEYIINFRRHRTSDIKSNSNIMGTIQYPVSQKTKQYNITRISIFKE